MRPDIAVTVVCGADYQAMAELVVPRVRDLLGLPVSVVNVPAEDVPGSPTDTRRARMRASGQQKLNLLRRYPGKRILVFDLDWVPLRAWDWDELSQGFEGVRTDRAFVAVRAQYEGNGAANTGFFIASPEHAPLFDDALERWRQLGDPKRWGWDEIYLNWAIEAARQPVAWLPSAYNLQCGDKEAFMATGSLYSGGVTRVALETYAAHACFAKDKLGAVRALCGTHPYPAVRDTEPAPPPSGALLGEPDRAKLLDSVVTGGLIDKATADRLRDGDAA